jgi:hypothetical protein
VGFQDSARGTKNPICSRNAVFETRHAIVADGSTGWPIPPDDEDALVDALLAAANDHRERRARGRRAQTASRRYDWAEIAARFASLYEELLASSPRQQVARGRRA